MTTTTAQRVVPSTSEPAPETGRVTDSAPDAFSIASELMADRDERPDGSRDLDADAIRTIVGHDEVHGVQSIAGIVGESPQTIQDALRFHRLADRRIRQLARQMAEE